jgi:hypothetical protein
VRGRDELVIVPTGSAGTFIAYQVIGIKARTVKAEELNALWVLNHLLHCHIALADNLLNLLGKR